MKPDWKDISSHSQSDVDRTPKTWKLELRNLKIVVTRHIYFAPDIWTIKCDPWFNNVALTNKDIDEAKEEAIELVKKQLEIAMSELKEFTK